MRTLSDRLRIFFSRLEVCENGCHEYTWGCNDEGYGNFWDEGTCKKAHRFAYEAYYGPIPKNLLVLHTCDNPPCCNPVHLYLGTDADNTRDKILRGRMADTNGEQNPAATITEELVLEILAHCRYTNLSHDYIAEEFNITRGHVNNIKMGRAWNRIHRQVTDVSYTD